MFLGYDYSPLNYSRRKVVAYPYEVTTPAAVLPVTLEQVKRQIKWDVNDDSQDEYLTLLVKAATRMAEEYTRRTFINTGYTTYRNVFSPDYMTLRRSKLQSVDSIQYLKDGVYVTVDTANYYADKSSDYSNINLVDGKSWPADADSSFDAIKIVFTAGYGSSADDVPEDLKLALLNHVSYLYVDRGDCGCEGNNKSPIPATTLAIYNDYKIMDITGGMYH